MSSSNTLRIITGALLVIALMSATAFATAGQPRVTDDMVSPTIIEEESIAQNTITTEAHQRLHTTKSISLKMETI